MFLALRQLRSRGIDVRLRHAQLRLSLIQLLFCLVELPSPTFGLGTLLVEQALVAIDLGFGIIELAQGVRLLPLILGHAVGILGLAVCQFLLAVGNLLRAALELFLGVGQLLVGLLLLRVILIPLLVELVLPPRA